mmetsp:Transcript_14321/g.61383  ORF Transcript_14321/g.61383 Transcript_14321/m.61383 type:complete len:329 (+) Transcript_14321:1382-2368(+)
MDAPPVAPRGGVLPDPGRPVRALGGGRGGVRPRPRGRRLGAQQRQLDVALVLVLLLPVLPRLRPGELREEVRQERRLHQALPASAQKHAGKVHLRAVARAVGRPEEGGVCRRRGLPAADGGPRRRVQGVHREARRRVQGAQGGEGGDDKGGTQGGGQTESRVERFRVLARVSFSTLARNAVGARLPFWVYYIRRGSKRPRHLSRLSRARAASRASDPVPLLQLQRQVHLRQVLEPVRRQRLDLRLGFRLEHDLHLLDPLGVLLDELLLQHVLPGLDILRRHLQPALLGDVELVQVRRAHAQPLDVRRRQVRAVKRHVLRALHVHGDDL